ncbi:c-type cytochrome [Dechloromonas sp. CZR5]|uniref:c-type cytochrome n=1 Tax=Dechloromonas sp. CZR5 TaxID=2608630 RepID=UPI0006250CA7|nr:c-type cytochrome [Dechloromonas sp. CZR5]
MKRSIVAMAAALLASPVMAAGGSPKVNYMLHCSGCHGPDGAGNPGVGIPDMRGSIGHFPKAKYGRDFLIQVPGTSQTSMTDAEVAVMMNWMLQQFSAAEVPIGTLPYTEQEVRQLRANRLADVPGRRAAIISELKAQGISIE